MIRRLLLVCLFKLISLSGYSQVKLHAIVSFDYSYGFSLGDLDDYIPEKTFDGVHFQYRHFFQRNFTLGIRTGWNSFRDELPRDVYETDRGTVSAIQTRFFYTMPFLITAHYYFRKSHYVMPYVGGGAGAYLSHYGKWFGVVETDDDSWNLGFSPEAGIIFPFKNSSLGLIVSGRYNQVFYSHNEIGNLKYAEASLGIYFGHPVYEDTY